MEFSEGMGGGGELRGVRVAVYHNNWPVTQNNRAKLYQETSYFDTNSRR